MSLSTWLIVGGSITQEIRVATGTLSTQGVGVDHGPELRVMSQYSPAEG